MQGQEYRHAYHEALPSPLPRDGWRRAEIHETNEISPLAKQFEADMRDLGYPRKDSFAVVLALGEAAGNAIRHGNQGDRSRSAVIGYHLSEDEVLLEVMDEGRGFDPYLVPSPLADEIARDKPSGRGLFLMRVYMTWIRYNRRGNRVILCKRRSVA
jgi:serine/threonine-protein kinase RsbW